MSEMQKNAKLRNVVVNRIKRACAQRSTTGRFGSKVSQNESMLKSLNTRRTDSKSEEPQDRLSHSSKFSQNRSNKGNSMVGSSVLHEDELFEQICHLGVIDFLQDWSLRKRVENLVKIVGKKKKDRFKHSAIPPGPYKERFDDYMVKHFLKPASDKNTLEGSYQSYKEKFIKSLES